ncbi:transglycosylase SLT domain-containing protein [Desulfonauticus submarinus]|nr:transglycosylase SLT domain-containing protein [Desulfonauticus submarinus]
MMLRIFMIWLFLSLSCWVWAETIYYYCDENGVYHFTDLPTSSKYKPFLVFRYHKYDPKKLDRLIKVYSKHYRLDPALVKAVIKVESNFEPEAESSKGAQGLMQITPITQKELDLDTPFDPASNIEAGIRYLKSLLNRFSSIELALAAYNAGPGNVKRYGGIPPFKETKEYVKKVLKIYQELKR